jgi:hypothetical protein
MSLLIGTISLPDIQVLHCNIYYDMTETGLQGLLRRLHAHPFELLKKVFEYLHLIHVQDLSDDELRDVFLFLFQPTTLIEIWSYALNTFPEHTIATHCHHILHGLRILVNLLGERYYYIFEGVSYSQLVSSSFLKSIINLHVGLNDQYRSILNSLPRELFKSYVSNLIHENECISKAIAVFEDTWCLDATVMAFQLVCSSKRQQMPYKVNNLKLLLSRAVETVPVELVFRRLFYQKTFEPFIAELIVSTLPDPSLGFVCFSACEIWGQSTFISSGNTKAIVYLYEAIYNCLGRLPKQQLNMLYDRHKSTLALVLSQSISNYLDSSVPSYRLLGMKLAKLFAMQMGAEIHFEELEVLEISATTDILIQETKARTEKLIDDDTSDEDELEAYDDPELNLRKGFAPSVSITRYFYLSVCLASKTYPTVSSCLILCMYSYFVQN